MAPTRTKRPSTSKKSSNAKRPKTNSTSARGGASKQNNATTGGKRKHENPARIEIVRQDEEAGTAAADMDIDPDLLDDSDGDGEDGGPSVSWLASLDEKAISRSRVELLKEHRSSKPKVTAEMKDALSKERKKKKALLADVPLLSTGPSKSKLREEKAIANKRKRLLKKGLSEEEVEAAIQEELESKREQQLEGEADGELLDDLEEDDLAFGSGASDDDLSLMSELESGDDMSDMDDFSDEDDGDLSGLDDLSDLGSGEGHDSGEEDQSSADEDSVHFDDNELFDSASHLSSSYSSGTESTDDESQQRRKVKRSKANRPSEDEDDLEATYVAPAKPPKSLPKKLPIIANGRVLPTGEAEHLATSEPSDTESEPDPKLDPAKQFSDYQSNPLGRRFGRMAIKDLLNIPDKSTRVLKAKVEIADLGREAIAVGEGEGGINFLRRLLSLTGHKLALSATERSAGEKPPTVDIEIRAMAMVSLLAVFLDVLPGYRIRSLTEEEKGTKVSQLVLRQREWEEVLIQLYRKFLENCEREISVDSTLAPVALHCMCQLVRQRPDFNFAVNIMDVVVKRVGRKGWDDGHQMCLDAIVHILSNDTTTTATNSLHIVRLVSRLTKARSFAIRPDVLSALLNLRLRDELGRDRGVRASTNAIYREQDGRKGIVRWNKEKDHKGRRGGKAKAAMSKKGSKKAREAQKEQDKIDKEMREAEGEINRDERERNMTETLKLLFALYFRVLKNEEAQGHLRASQNPLLPAALEGLARFAHLINVDFFMDVLEVLKNIIKIKRSDVEEDDADEGERATASTVPEPRRNDLREKLLCIVAAFELLQGQGEALNIDLGDFVSSLYAIILPLALSPTIEDIPLTGRNTSLTTLNQAAAKLAHTEADLLFRALAHLFLSPRSVGGGGSGSATRTLAFSKRLLTSSLHWPSHTQRRTLSFLKSLLIREPKLEAMLETDDRKIDGRWDGTVDEPERAEPESTSWWEASLLMMHGDERVRSEARTLMTWTRE